MIASRVPDLRYLLDAVARDDVLDPGVSLETAGIGLVGHSFGGWTALATAEQDPRIAAVVALAPAGSSKTKPGILQLHLSFARSRSVPTMYLVARDDVTLPLPGMIELFERTPGSKTMVVLSNADHLHFVDDIADDHEAVRNMPFTGELTWIPKEMRPITELCLPGHAHDFVRGLALSHFDAVLLPRQEARRFLANELARALARRHIEAYSYEPSK
jgi:pimeloyl-ACP methyl ester carboxylesterase